MLDVSDTPAGAIARLDASLARRGQTIRLRRDAVTITVKGFVRGFTADELVAGSGISQDQDKVILSPSSLSGWAGPPPGEDDWCEIDGKFRSVVLGRAIKMNDVVVRIELQVKG